MLSRDDRTSRWAQSREGEDLDGSIAPLPARIREFPGLVRASAPVIGELQALQEASALLKSLNIAALQQAFAEPVAPPLPASVEANAAPVSSLPLPMPLPT